MRGGPSARIVVAAFEPGCGQSLEQPALPGIGPVFSVANSNDAVALSGSAQLEELALALRTTVTVQSDSAATCAETLPR
jgi:hypothetical protein